MAGSHLSKDFYDLVRNIGEAKSKQEEDQIIGDEVGKLQSLMASNATPKKMREYLLRMMYCEMLGHDASFGHIHAVNMTQQSTLLEKRVGYLAVMCTLHSEHELIILLINTIQKDLQSSNWMEVCTALTCVCKLIGKETIPAVYNLIVKCLDHNSEHVRKKAVVALQRCHEQDPSAVKELPEKLSRVLCDRDPCVMAASLSLLETAIKTDVAAFKNMVPSLVSILKQIIEHRLHNSYDYHRTPAPWCQVQLLRCMALLGTEKAAAEEMYEVLNEVLRRADTGINIGYAVSYECVRTICCIYPNTQLIDAGAAKIGELLKSDNRNLRYMGLNALALMIQVNPRYAAEHQAVVIDSLEDADETLKRKTLALLFKMTNQVNVTAVVDKMVENLKESQDPFLRADLVTKITELAERFAPSNEWYIETMNTVFRTAGELCRAGSSENLLRLLAEGAGEDDAADEQLRRFAVRIYAEMCSVPHIADTLAQVMCWVLGEYAYLEEALELEDVASNLCDLMDRTFEQSATYVWIVNALTKLVAQMGECPEQVKEMAEKYAMSRNVDLQQRCLQLLCLAQDMDTMQSVLPVDASCEDLEFDEDLAFLDDFVQQALDDGKPDYIPLEEREDGVAESAGVAEHSLRFDAYAKPLDPYQAMVNSSIQAQAAAAPTPSPTPAGPGAASSSASTGPSLTPQPPSQPPSLSSLATKKRWGESGYQGDLPRTSASSVSSSSSAPGPAPPGSSSAAGGGLGAQAAGGGGGLFGGLGSSAAPSSSQHRAAAAPPPSAHKQQLANSLFGGLSGGGSGGVGVGRAAASKPQPAAAPKKPKPAKGAKPANPDQGPQSTNLLFDLAADMSSAAPQPSTAGGGGGGGGGGFDLMDLLNDLPASSAPPSTPASGGMGMGMGMVMQPQAPAQPQAQAQSARSRVGGAGANSGSSLISGLDSLMSSAPQQRAAGVGGGMDALGALFSSSPAAPAQQQQPALVPSHHEPDLMEFAQGGAVAQAQSGAVAVVSDANILITSSRALQGKQLCVDVVFANRTTQPLRTVTATFDLGVPALNLGVAHGAGVQAAVNNNKISIPMLPAMASSTIRLTIALASAVLPLPLSSIRGQFQYTVGDPGRLVPLHNTLPLSVVDFVTPHFISEEQFGALWGRSAQERKVNVAITQPDPNACVAALQSALHVAHIKTIKNEVIAAGKDVSDRVCLVHCRVSASRWAVTVRTGDVRFTESLSRTCQGLQA